MQKTLYFKSQFVLSEASIAFNSNAKMFIPLYTRFSLIKPSFSITPSNLSLLTHNPSLPLSLWNQTQIRNPITCVRSSRRRIGYQRSRKLVFEIVSFVASNLNMVPEPLALAIREFGGGDGGGHGFWKGFGGGGFDGWGRKRKSKLGFFVFLFFCGLGMWLVLGKQIDFDVFLGVLAISLLGVSIRGWKRGFKDWILGFCFCAVLVGLGLRRENFQRWEKFGAMVTLRRRKGRRAM
ncbi:uncharacterized protein LOC130781842 [Actinidia eriantha]|uniref:uncharacterized protein LOC130781842 n=1 Tax=Actinidia eriantha TaxID=165200 RepID=UPI00258A16B4|nr:uncharacterized protein LOC130781842 [Actinidia eriantha]